MSASLHHAPGDRLDEPWLDPANAGKVTVPVISLADRDFFSKAQIASCAAESRL
jgi:hypothetical protein